MTEKRSMARGGILAGIVAVCAILVPHVPIQVKITLVAIGVIFWCLYADRFLRRDGTESLWVDYAGILVVALAMAIPVSVLLKSKDLWSIGLGLAFVAVAIPCWALWWRSLSRQQKNLARKDAGSLTRAAMV